MVKSKFEPCYCACTWDILPVSLLSMNMGGKKVILSWQIHLSMINMCCFMSRDSREAIKTLLLHLQRLMKSMNSKQVLEGKKINIVYSKLAHEPPERWQRSSKYACFGYPMCC